MIGKGSDGETHRDQRSSTLRWAHEDVRGIEFGGSRLGQGNGVGRDTAGYTGTRSALRIQIEGKKSNTLAPPAPNIFAIYRYRWPTLVSVPPCVRECARAAGCLFAAQLLLAGAQARQTRRRLESALVCEGAPNVDTIAHLSLPAARCQYFRGS
ncbi:hypothetical protein B0H14DRAFT_2560528 [Mycena olivaceomarginata]|nr:hypothetical protein B0H14DRAFT_2560528 [Mycena olivaceomarginata]